MSNEQPFTLGGYSVNADTGDVSGGTTNASGGGGMINNVWSTVQSGFSSLTGSSGFTAALGAIRDIQIAKTRATPSGSAPSVVNQFPGTQSPFPQNDSKIVTASVPGLGGFMVSLPIIIGAALLIFLALRRG